MATLQYFNAAGTSWPKPRVVHEAVERAFRLEPLEWAGAFESTLAQVAQHFCVDPDDLLVTPSCTSALSTVIADLPIPAGGRIVTSSMEHHAVTRPLTLWERKGVDVVRVPRGEDVFDLDRFANLCKSGVNAVVVSAVASLTGEGLPIDTIVELAHQANAVVVVDGAQAAGWLPFDLPRLQVDAFAFAGHKGPQAPTGVGGLYLRPGRFWTTPLASCSSDACRPRPGYCDTGSTSLPGLAGVEAGLAWMKTHHTHASTMSLMTRFRQEALSLGVQVLGGEPAVPTCAFVVAGRTSGDVAAELRKRGIVVSSGFQCAPDAHAALGTSDGGAVRVSLGPTTTSSDIERLIHELRAVTSPSFLPHL